MIQIPISINGPQASLLNDVLIKGGSDLFLVDEPSNGSQLLVIVARGAARDYAKARLLPDKPEAPTLPETEPGQLPTRVVPIREGVTDARPGGSR